MTHQWEILKRLPRPVVSSEWAERWRTSDVPVRQAATVILVNADVQVWMMRRVSTMAFAPDVWVFPGGRVEDSDRVPDPVRAAAVRELAEETGLQLGPDELLPWARWTTPPGNTRRYDTHFFVAEVGERSPQNPSTEADIARWWDPREMLESDERVLPPTQAMLLELAEKSTWSQVQAATDGRVIAGFTPQLRYRDGEYRVAYPDETGTFT